MQSQYSTNSAHIALKKQLDKRFSDDNLRTLRIHQASSIDFCSNDYLGFARSLALKKKVEKLQLDDSKRLNGSTGSRLLTGNSVVAEEVESYIANYHNAESGLIFNSGYDANLGLFSCLAQRTDTILYDELSHASIIDGICLSHAKSYKFRHNNISHLEELLGKSIGEIYVAVESVYSMDGDFAPLIELIEVCKKYDANLIVDEAHATGLFGKKGEGRVVELEIEKDVFARMHTFGKALGCHGAIILGSEVLKEYLINFSRPFIYSTALPLQTLISIKSAYEYLENNSHFAETLTNNIQYFKRQAIEIDGIKLIESDSSIQCILIPGNNESKMVATRVQSAGFNVWPILSPTVAEGSERIRICLHSFNTEIEISTLIHTLKSLILSPELNRK